MKSAKDIKESSDVLSTSKGIDKKAFPENSYQSKMTKQKKSKRFIESPANAIKIRNMFESLPIEEFDSVDIKIIDLSDSEANKSENLSEILKEKEKLIQNVRKVVIKKGWKKFESKNRFEVLEDNPEEDVTEMIKRNIILNTPKHCLKKCRRCKFKKRTCTLDPLTCQAIKRFCIKCKKTGHYPQSSYCKAEEYEKKGSKSKIGTQMDTSSKMILNNDVIEFVKERIREIEKQTSPPSSKLQNYQKLMQTMICLMQIKNLVQTLLIPIVSRNQY